MLQASARFGRDGAIINGGLHWRVYADKPDQTGVFRLLKEDSSAQPTFVLPAGGYIVHVSLRAGERGQAGAICATRRCARCSTFRRAGCGSKAASATSRIPTGQISFDIFKGSQFEPRRAAADGVRAC